MQCNQVVGDNQQDAVDCSALHRLILGCVTFDHPFDHTDSPSAHPPSWCGVARSGWDPILANALAAAVWGGVFLALGGGVCVCVDQ